MQKTKPRALAAVEATLALTMYHKIVDAEHRNGEDERVALQGDFLVNGPTRKAYRSKKRNTSLTTLEKTGEHRMCDGPFREEEKGVRAEPPTEDSLPFLTHAATIGSSLWATNHRL